MTNIRIDSEFQSKIPPLTEKEFEQLEENIVEAGQIYEPIVVWNNVIIDGHNRYKIALKHPDIPYSTREMHFEDKYAAFDWMYKNQLGRRNLTDQQRDYLIGKMYEARKYSHGGDRNTEHAKDGTFTASVQNGHMRHGRIGEQIGKELGIGNGTVRRAYDFARGVDAVRDVNPEAADKILSGDSGLRKREVAEIKDATPEQVKKLGDEIVEGKLDRKKRLSTQERKQINEGLQAIVDQFNGKTTEEYTIDNLLEELRSNCETFISSVKMLFQIRANVLCSHEQWVMAHRCIKETLVDELNHIMERK